MNRTNPNDRLKQLQGFLKTKGKVRLGDVELLVYDSINPEFVPNSNDQFYVNAQDILKHLRWMIQKGNLNQDMFLTGAPGYLRRRIALMYAQLCQREVEYVSLSRDVTDSDLKQRREIINGTAIYTDQACVRAAMFGRILILDGVEKAERNVLPILNNLLENREMALEDGRFLVHPKRYDQLVNSGSLGYGQSSKLVRTSENFLVIALGLPVPIVIAIQLILAPFRSRFQARNVTLPQFSSQRDHLRKTFPNVNPVFIEKLISLSFVLQSVASDQGSQVPDFPVLLDSFMKVLNSFPKLSPNDILEFIYPFPYFSNADEQMKNVIFAIMKRFDLQPSDNTENTIYTISKIETIYSPSKSALDFQIPHKRVQFVSAHLGLHSIEMVSGSRNTADIPHSALLAKLLMAISTGDVCIVGDKGCGKTMLIRALSTLLGYSVEYIPLYKDMSSRDFLQRRNTTSSGDTYWENSGLVTAAIEGSIAVLDPIEVVSIGTIASLQRLIVEREMPLPNGAFLIHPDRFLHLMKQNNWTKGELIARGIYPVHPSFRIVAIARPNQMGSKGNWLNQEILSLFSFVVMRPMSIAEEKEVMLSLFPHLSKDIIDTLTSLAHSLRIEKDETLSMLASNLSTRQLLRIGRRLSVYPKESLHDSILKVSLSRFLPSLAREALDSYLLRFKIQPSNPPSDTLKCELISINGVKKLQIGDVACDIATNSNPLLIPNVLFYENARQTLVLQDILKDYILGENILLIGNQGVGKNKIIDYFLQLMRLPREYIQLHRDTTVYSLTSCPTIKDGLLVYEDSPLVKAVKNGYILVIDEADKAPTHVTSVLKSLIEDREMVLSDGRRIVGDLSDAVSNAIPIHPDFRMIVLANRPGFPFLGNDFFREIGDVFAAHCVDNPDPDSELSLLSNYGPSVSKDVLRKLVASFSDLRRLVDEGLINYPYSTRELVNVVKHLEAFPGEGLSRALQNVFDFDNDEDIRKILIETMHKNGIPTGFESNFSVEISGVIELSPPTLIQKWKSELNLVRNVICVTQDLNMRGTWDLGVPKDWEVLDQKNGRAVVFSEWLYSFKLDDSMMDLIIGSDYLLYGISSTPATFHIISPDHRKKKHIPLYEYIPTHKGISLSVVEIGMGRFCIHNSESSNLIVLDLLKNQISSIVVLGIDTSKESFIANSSSDRHVNVWYQQNQNFLYILNLKTLSQSKISLDFAIETIHFAYGNRWIIQEPASRNRKIHWMSVDFVNGECNVTIYPILIVYSHKQDNAVLKQMKLMDPSTMWINVCPPETLGAYIEDVQGELLGLNGWLRDTRDDCQNGFINLSSAFAVLPKTSQYVNVIPSQDVEKPGCFVEILNPKLKQLRKFFTNLITIPHQAKRIRDQTLGDSILGTTEKRHFSVGKILETQNGDILVMDAIGNVNVFQADHQRTMMEMKAWTNLTGALDSGTLRIIYEGDHPSKLSNEEILDATEGLIGNEGKGIGGDGGEGNGEGSGEGGGSGGASNGQGSGGPAQALTVDARREVGELPKEVTDAQKELHRENMANYLKQIDMKSQDMDKFLAYKENVQMEIRELRVVLESVEAKNKERIWMRNKTSGDIDDTRLVEGLSGERAIYRLRGEDDDSMFHQKPKKLFFVFELSASMMRFNGYDGRLDRSLECAITFRGFEHKFNYKLFAHSGDGPDADLIPDNIYPKNEKDIFTIVNRMQVHASYCMSGDNTLSAISTAVKKITNEDADDYFVVVLSDANLHQYNISTHSLATGIE
ncbi:von Willebrand factor A domain-containing protein 8 [Globomyces sp. JEL0801]|nr:von Willebrand factor A domain-containing protein 8 [Globomyces sp. JEL0801]